MKGTLYGVGIGPGDPELLTLKAVRIIKESAVIAVPGKKREDTVAYQIVKQIISNLDQKEFLEVEMPMTKDKDLLEKSHREGAERIGQPGPPPGLSLEGTKEETEHFSLKRGQWLILASDGVDSTEALACCRACKEESVAELATRILHSGQTDSTDDATVVIIRLSDPG